jgi:Lipase (class 3)
VSLIDWNAAIKYAKLVALAEGIPPAGDDDQLKAALTTAGYTYLETIWGNELATDINPHEGEIVSYGFLALSPTQELVASIRGTSTLLEWLHDAAFLMVASPITGLSGHTEDGFTAIYKSLRTAQAANSTTAVAAIKAHLTTGQAKTVTVCGHSLGGALATLLVADVAINTPYKTPVGYSFASPRTGDHFFAGSFDATVATNYRIVNRQDLVPQLPPIIPLPYEHVNTKFELNPPFGKIQQTLLCMHHLATYIWLMEQQPGATGNDPIPQGCAAT